MRTERELVNLVSEQVYHWVHRCGKSEEDLAELVNEAMGMILTDEEAMEYTHIGYDVKMSIML